MFTTFTGGWLGGVEKSRIELTSAKLDWSWAWAWQYLRDQNKQAAADAGGLDTKNTIGDKKWIFQRERRTVWLGHVISNIWREIGGDLDLQFLSYSIREVIQLICTKL